jgi:hypothetical protein
VRLLRRPLAEDEFWSLIGVMGGRVDEDALARLTDALRARGRKTAVAFQERLAQALFDLDREELADQPVRFAGDPSDEDPIPLSDDGFLYLRAGIVARGRETYRAVLDRPAMLADGAWDECEDLLYVAEEVAGDDIDTKVSYETGSNAIYWTPRPEPEREAWDQGVRQVFVDCRDLSEPMEGERWFPDGRVEPMVEYLPPRYVPRELVTELCETFAKVVAVNGGLPTGLDAQQIQVLIDFGDDWRARPEVGNPVVDEIFGDLRVVPVRVSVSAADVRGWSSAVRRDGLLALTATCVLAVLPDDHAARPEIEQLRARGAGHLPV